MELFGTTGGQCGMLLNGTEKNGMVWNSMEWYKVVWSGTEQYRISPLF